MILNDNQLINWSLVRSQPPEPIRWQYIISTVPPTWKSQDPLFCIKLSDVKLPSIADRVLLYRILKRQSYFALEVSGNQTDHLSRYLEMALNRTKHEIALEFYSIDPQLLTLSIYQQLLRPLFET